MPNTDELLSLGKLPREVQLRSHPAYLEAQQRASNNEAAAVRGIVQDIISSDPNQYNLPVLRASMEKRRAALTLYLKDNNLDYLVLESQTKLTDGMNFYGAGKETFKPGFDNLSLVVGAYHLAQAQKHKN